MTRHSEGLGFSGLRQWLRLSTVASMVVSLVYLLLNHEVKGVVVHVRGLTVGLVLAIVVIMGVVAYLVLSGHGVGISGVVMTSTPTSQVYVYLSDRPVKVDHLYVTISQIALHREGGGNNTWVTCGLTQTTVDLAQLVNTSELIAKCSLTNGTYNLIRLYVTSVQAVVNGQTYDCTLPSSKFEIPLEPSPIVVNGTSYEVNVDFGAVNHVVITGNGKCVVVPVIHVLVKGHS